MFRRSVSLALSLVALAAAQTLPDLTITAFNTAGMSTDTQSLQVSGLVSVTVKNAGGSAVTMPFTVFLFEDRNQNSTYDPTGGDVAMGQATVPGPLAANAETPVLVPVSGTVLFRGNVITGIVDNGRSIPESNESNNSAGTGGSRAVPPVGVLNPVLKWRKATYSTLPTFNQVLVEPVVADISGDGVPDLVYSAMESVPAWQNSVLRAISGVDGSELWTVSTPSLRVRSSSTAIGDIDGDGRPEIVTMASGASQMLAFEHDGTFKWRSPTILEVGAGAPSLADLDGDGQPEIVIGSSVLSRDGSIRWQGQLGRGYQSLGALSTPVDLDLDGRLEVVAGNTAYRADGSVYWSRPYQDGFTAVGNFDTDTFPEIVLVSSGQVYLLEHDGSVKWGPVALPGGGLGGPPTIGDMDGDGAPEIGVAGASRYVVFTAGGLVKWQSVTQDATSNSTGSSVFDFEGDGQVEVLYRDEQKFRIYRGRDGAVLFETAMPSATVHEFPVVADVDADGRSDIVVTSDLYLGSTPGAGVYVFSNPSWVGTRKIMNQHAYSITNVNDDGSIPRTPQNNWQVPGLNNFRLNTFSQPQAASTGPDYTSSLIRKNDSTFPTSVRLTARVGNGGGASSGPPGGSEPGRFVIGPDVNTLSTNTASPVEVRFGLNVANWLTERRQRKNLLLIECLPSFPACDYTPALRQALETAGYRLTVASRFNWTSAELAAFDAIFVTQEIGTLKIPTASAVLDFVRQGGGLYVAGGTQNTNQAIAEREAWRPLTEPLGFEFDGTYTSINPTPSVAHPISAGVSIFNTFIAQGFRPLGTNSTLQILAAGGGSIGFLGVGTLGGGSTSTNIVTNGGFETGVNGTTCLTPVTRIDAGSALANSIVGWSIVSGQIDWNRTSYPSYEGSCSMNLEGDIGRIGAVEQVITTVPGQTYDVVFYLAADPVGGPATSPMRLSAAGTSATFTAVRTQTITWSRQTWRFTATAGSTTLRFESMNSPAVGGFGPVIDAVEVRQIPSAGLAPTDVSFYRGDPGAGGTLIGRTRTTRALGPGEFEDVSVTWNNPPAGLHPIVAVADDPAAVAETDETNNKAGANVLLGIGPFPLVDGLLTRHKDTAVDLTWTPVPGAASYNLYRRSTPTGAFQLVRSGLTATRFSDASLTNGTTYQYLVRWVGATGLESADGTEASAIPTPDARAANTTPPTILSNPVTRARTLARYSYQVTASDPDVGDTLTYTVAAGPAGMNMNPSTGLIEWTPTAQQFGYVNVTVRVEDRTARFATQTYRLFVEAEIINNAPLITSTPITRGASGEPYGYRVTARDPDTGDLLTYALTAAPAGMTINQATGTISWIPTRVQVGTQTVTVRVTDLAGLSATQTFAVAVARGNKAPVFSSLPVTSTRAGSGFRYQPVATDPDADPLTFSLVSVVPATTMTVDTATGLVSWAVPATGAAALYDITIRVVDDGGLAATQAFRVSVGAPNQAPVFTSTALTSATSNTIYRYAATATDPNLPNDALFFALRSAPTGMTINGNTGLIEWMPPASAANTTPAISIEVKDIDGLTALQNFTLRVGPPDTTRPSVSFQTSLNGATLTTDTPILGTVNDDNLRAWRVDYRPVDSPEWLTLSSGTTAVTNGSLGTIPATLWANDVYRMRLYAEDAVGSVTSPEVEVVVDTKQLKMGDFTLSFEDLRVPGFTFPISILRKYDTKRPQSGDFGLGWTLGYSDVNVRLDVNKNAFVTLPDGRRVNFKYTPQCAAPSLIGCFLIYNTLYTPAPGVYDKLENLDCPQTISFGASALCGFDAFRAEVWKLTTKEGLKYTITRGVVTRMEDRVGNWMDISPNGVRTNFGRDVTFERDSAGRITRVNEPGGTAFLRYEYDTRGRLVRFLDQMGAATTFDYENAGYPHYLTKITDAMGRQVVRNVFNPEGRLVAQCDPNGNTSTLEGCSRYLAQPNTATFSGVNARGFRVELVSDERGNIVSSRSFLSENQFLETVRTFDSSNNLIMERDPDVRPGTSFTVQTGHIIYGFRP